MIGKVDSDAVLQSLRTIYLSSRTPPCDVCRSYPLKTPGPNRNGRMASAGGSRNKSGGSGYGGSGYGVSGPRKQKATYPTVPRTGCWQQKPLTESEWEQDPPISTCIKGTCEDPKQEDKGESKYTYEKKK